MKKLLIAILIVCFMASTAFAGHHRSHHRHNNQFAVGLILGAVTSAVIINNNRSYDHQPQWYYQQSRWHHQQSRYPQRYYRQHHRSYAGVCQNFPIRNQWGDIIRVDTYCR